MMLRPEEIIEKMSRALGGGLVESSVKISSDGHLNRRDQRIVHLRVQRDSFHRAVSLLREISPLHISVPFAAVEGEENIELIYPFMIYSGLGNFSELPVILRVDVPRNDFRIRTCTDIVPGILVMEREAMEMLGLTVEDIPDRRRLFTPDSLPEGYWPQRGPEPETSHEETAIEE